MQAQPGRCARTRAALAGVGVGWTIWPTDAKMRLRLFWSGFSCRFSACRTRLGDDITSPTCLRRVHRRSAPCGVAALGSASASDVIDGGRESGLHRAHGRGCSQHQRLAGARAGTPGDACLSVNSETPLPGRAERTSLTGSHRARFSLTGMLADKRLDFDEAAFGGDGGTLDMCLMDMPVVSSRMLALGGRSSG